MTLASCPVDQRKGHLASKIYPQVLKKLGPNQGIMAGRITARLLEEDDFVLVHMLEHQGLDSRIEVLFGKMQPSGNLPLKFISIEENWGF